MRVQAIPVFSSDLLSIRGVNDSIPSLGKRAG
jgi:hypothetical protein